MQQEAPTPEEDSSDSSDEDSADEQVFKLSSQATEGVLGKKTIKLQGRVGNQEILILIDSGSSCTFISDKVVASLKCFVVAAPSISMTMTNGQKVLSNQEITDFTWWSQGHTFTQTARVLPIPYYDHILGMD